MLNDIARDRMKQFRISKGLSQDAIAAQLGISESGYRKIENGDQSPTLDKLDKILEVLGIDPKQFFDFGSPVTFNNYNHADQSKASFVNASTPTSEVETVVMKVRLEQLEKENILLRQIVEKWIKSE